MSSIITGFIDRAKNTFKRKPIIKYVKVRDFDAGALDRLKSSWTTSTQNIDELLQSRRKVMVARSRDAAQNNGYAKRFLGLLKTNICGPDGFKFQAMTKSNKNKPDNLLNQTLETIYADFSKLGNFDVTEQLSRTDAEALFITTLATDGEVIMRMVDGFNNKHGFALQFIDSELLDVELNKTLTNGNVIRMGVEFNTWRKPVAYWFIDTDTRKEYTEQRKYKRIPADEIIHEFLKMRINQTRGVPWMHAALSEMDDLHGYKEGAIVNARVGASKMLAVTTPSGNEYAFDSLDASGNKYEEVEPGMIKEYPEGTTFHNFDPVYPHSQYDAFIKTTLRGMSSGLEVSYNSLASDLEGVNFSSIRAGVLEDREVWKTLQRWCIDHFCTLVYNKWLKRQLLNGNIKVKGQPLDIDREEKCQSVMFQGRRWDWVDPLKDMSANEKAQALGVKSLTQIIRDMGRDPDEVWQEMQQEQEKLKEMGISLNTTNTGNSAPTNNQDDTTNEQDNQQTDDQQTDDTDN